MESVHEITGVRVPKFCIIFQMVLELVYLRIIAYIRGVCNAIYLYILACTGLIRVHTCLYLDKCNILSYTVMNKVYTSIPKTLCVVFGIFFGNFWHIFGIPVYLYIQLNKNTSISSILHVPSYTSTTIYLY